MHTKAFDCHPTLVWRLMLAKRKNKLFSQFDVDGRHPLISLGKWSWLRYLINYVDVVDMICYYVDVDMIWYVTTYLCWCCSDQGPALPWLGGWCGQSQSVPGLQVAEPSLSPPSPHWPGITGRSLLSVSSVPRETASSENYFKLPRRWELSIFQCWQCWSQTLCKIIIS